MASLGSRAGEDMMTWSSYSIQSKWHCLLALIIWSLNDQASVSFVVKRIRRPKLVEEPNNIQPVFYHHTFILTSIIIINNTIVKVIMGFMSQSSLSCSGEHNALQDPVGGDASVCEGNRCWASIKEEGLFYSFLSFLLVSLFVCLLDWLLISYFLCDWLFIICLQVARRTSSLARRHQRGSQIQTLLLMEMLLITISLWLINCEMSNNVDDWWPGADTLHPKAVDRSREELRIGIQVDHLFKTLTGR